MTRGPALFLLVLVGLAAAAAGAWLASRQSAAPDPDGLAVSQPGNALVLQAPRPLPAFSLVDQAGAPFGQERLAGHWSLVFFGFTHCPDVCPTTLNTLAGVADRLRAGDGPVPRVLMVSVDPMRDTPEVLAGYLPYFDPSFTGLTGEMAEVSRLARAVGVAWHYGPAGEDGGYTVDHTASLFLVDPQGRLAAIFSTPHRVEALSAEIRRIAGAGP